MLGRKLNKSRKWGSIVELEISSVSLKQYHRIREMILYLQWVFLAFRFKFLFTRYLSLFKELLFCFTLPYLFIAALIQLSENLFYFLMRYFVKEVGRVVFQIDVFYSNQPFQSNNTFIFKNSTTGLKWIIFIHIKIYKIKTVLVSGLYFPPSCYA